MIKTQVYILLVISGLALFFASCNRVPDYDKRLVKADNLVFEHTQEAKDILLEINPTELNEANQAYYNLLFTQASYLNEDDSILCIKGDSLITHALEYYKHHRGDREMFTRSYIYKGAVFDVLGQADSAMTYYKWAELYADKDDHFNRGYAQLRMGSLYRRCHAWDGRDIEKYADAVKSFKKSNNNLCLMSSLNQLGALYRFRNPDKAEETLNEAIKLAEIKKDTANIIHSTASLAYFYYMQAGKLDKESAEILYNKANQQLQKILQLNKLSVLTANEYATFASVYANNEKVDSANVFMGLAIQHYGSDSSYYHSQPYLDPMAQISKAQGNMFNYYRYSHESDSIDRLLSMNQDIITIMYSEIDCEKEHKEEEAKDRRKLYFIMGGLMALLLLLALWFYRRSHRYDKLVLELKDQSSSQLSDLSSMQQNISEMQINDERLKSFISSHMSMMREMIDACYHEPNNRIAENMKRIIKFQESNKDNWVKLYDYIDMEHNNIMTRTREQYPQLNDKDLLLLALTCMGYSYIQTAIIMGYSNATSVSVLKQRLAQKMGLEGSLNEYIEQNSNAKNE
jgi:tetratricopeptide (TPR) repeat protein